MVKTGHEYKRSGLLLLRIWVEPADENISEVEWHGKVQSVVDGRARQFRGEADLIRQIAVMLSTNSVSGNDAGQE